MPYNPIINHARDDIIVPENNDSQDNTNSDFQESSNADLWDATFGFTLTAK